MTIRRQDDGGDWAAVSVGGWEPPALLAILAAVEGEIPRDEIFTRIKGEAALAGHSGDQSTYGWTSALRDALGDDARTSSLFPSHRRRTMQLDREAGVWVDYDEFKALRRTGAHRDALALIRGDYAENLSRVDFDEVRGQLLTEINDSRKALGLASVDSPRQAAVPEMSRADPRLALRPPMHNLPSQGYRPIFGRESEVQKVLDHLQPYPHSQYPTVTLDGVGGVGKTALALAVAMRCLGGDEANGANRFDAIVWSSAKREILSASGTLTHEPTLRNLDDIFAAIAHTTGHPELLSVAPPDRYELARRVLSDLRVLLVLDNLESVDDERVLSFIRDLPAPTKALITTRHRIDGALPIRLGGLSHSDSLDYIDSLLLDHESLELTATDRNDVAELTSGIPLAIQWTVSQIAFGRPVAGVLQRLRSARGEFAAFCFRESYGLIDTDDKVSTLHVFMALSYFPYGARRDAVANVSGLAHAPQERDGALAELLRLSLVDFANGRFTLLPLTRDYVLAEVGRDLQFKEESQDRWLDWAVSVASSSSSGGADLDHVIVEDISREYGNIVFAIDVAFALKRFDTWVNLLKGLEFYWLGTGRWTEFREHLGLARSLAPYVSDRLHFSLRLAWLHVLAGETDMADELLVSAKLMLAADSNRYEEMRYWDFLGQLRLAQGANIEALAAFERALELAVEEEDERGRFAAAKYAGEAALAAGDRSAAQGWLERAEAELDGELGRRWRRGTAHALHLRGLLLTADRAWEAAIAALQLGLENLTYWPDPRLSTRIQRLLAHALAATDRVSDAHAVLDDARETLVRLNLHAELAELETTFGRSMSRPQLP